MATEHEPGQHALLSPSSSERWIDCPASVRMSAQLVGPPPPSSIYADEGTAAHALGELMARHQLLGTLTDKQFDRQFKTWWATYEKSVADYDDMVGHIQGYVEFLRARMAPGTVLLLEQRLPTGVPSSGGTSDAVLVSPTAVEIVDLKYGMGIQVEAAANSQLRLYGIGALEAFGDLLGYVETVTCTIYQPRLNHVDSETLTADELRRWRDSLIPIAELALGPDAPFGPSDRACRWCPVSGQCPAQLEFVVNRDFTVVAELLSPDELANALYAIPGILAWCAAVQDVALDLMYSKGESIPGYKVVMSAGRRSVTQPEKAIETLLSLGYDKGEITTQKIKGIGELQKITGTDFDLLSDFIEKSEGKPSIAHEDDRRPSVNPNDEAKKAFTDE